MADPTLRPARPRFGTDGVRGAANSELTAEYALAFGRAVARVLHPTDVYVGRDPRRSGPMFEGALCAGLVAEGVTVHLLGVCPTPAVAWASATTGRPGVMISASHNPFGDNGLKVFSAGGLKLSDAEQAAFEPVLAELLDGAPPARPPAAVPAVAPVLGDTSVVAGYAASVAASIEGRRLDGCRVVIDCANGAASAVAPDVLGHLGAELTVLAADPDGVNINDGCGSTHLGPLQAEVLRTGAALGLAFDGDADRLLAVDGDGRVIDGDQLIAMLATDRHRRGALAQDTVVVTVMTNLGFRLGMRRAGIAVAETAVGDRYVLEELERGGYSLGGEQSGHVIFRDLATTGDGLLSAVQVLDLCCRSGRPLGELADEAMTRLPQVLRNVRLRTDAATAMAALRDDIARVGAELGERGRVLVRPSGTEPLIRVMAEAADQAAAEEAVARLVAAAEQLGG
ncbi:MAG: phosphoglucosamine mutase [Acidimicrobiales bacterium]